MQRCIGQHHADCLDPGGEIGGKAGLTSRGEQNDRVRRREELRFFLSAQSKEGCTASMSGSITARGLAGLPLRLRRRIDGLG